MDKKKPDTLVQIKRRNRKAVLLTVAIITLFVAGVLLTRYFFLNKGLNFGDVAGASTQEESSLTKINFIDSGSVKSTTGTFGSIKSSYTPDFTNKFWVKFNSIDKTVIGFLDADLKFTKVYELPSSVKLIKLLDDSSILFTDEPLKEQPVLYYQQQGGDVIKFSTLDFQDTYLSIYFDPSEKLIYYLGKDNANTYFLYSVNEKGKESSLFKTGDFTEKVKIVAVDESYLYFKDGQICYQLNFGNKKTTQIDCALVIKNELLASFQVRPEIQSVYSSSDSGIISKINNRDGSKEDLFALQPNQVVSKFSYSNNKIIFSRASLNPAGETTYTSKDVALDLLDLQNNQVVEITFKMPSEVISNYYSFSDKFLALSPGQSSKLEYYVSIGMSGQVYIGDVAPVSFATITKYWIDIDFGMNVSNIEVLNGDFTL